MGIIQTGPGSALAYASASGGKVYAFNTISTTPMTLVPANPNRQSITFHNPHASINMYVTQATDYNGTTIIPGTGTLGGCFVIFPGNTLTLTGEVQKAWQGFSASGSNLPFTVLDSNT